jgi:hypothetical protein
VARRARVLIVGISSLQQLCATIADSLAGQRLNIQRFRFGFASLPFDKISYCGDDYRDGDGDKCLTKNQGHRNPLPVRVSPGGCSFQFARTSTG